MNTLHFRKNLLSWYESHKRDLPWRVSPTPYRVWISEIILQQTRVEQGINYYYSFIEKFPDCVTLAASSENDVLKMWQGLGYYSRARNLHIASKQILNNHKGIFPNRFEEIKKLKGVGEYTAAAIASISFKEPVAAIDGNVYRVLSRLYAIDLPINSGEGKKNFKELANQLVDPVDPGNFNQAIMEFGALQCTPVNPDCSICPFRNGCKAFQNNMVKLYPIKNKGSKVRNRYFNYIVVEYEDKILFHKRIEKDIWKNLYDFPLIETNQPVNPEILFHSEDWNLLFNNKMVLVKNISNVFIHQLSHQRIHARFYHVIPEYLEKIPINCLLTDKKDIFRLPVPKIIEKYLLKTDLIN